MNTLDLNCNIIISLDLHENHVYQTVLDYVWRTGIMTLSVIASGEQADTAQMMATASLNLPAHGDVYFDFLTNRHVILFVIYINSKMSY